ncbi:MAG: serine protease [Cyanobacteria bacterium]|nr:serine protease [Cyanobacteriota bacterium]
MRTVPAFPVRCVISLLMHLLVLVSLPLYSAFVLSAFAPPVVAQESWEVLDKRIKSQVYQLNVGLKLRLADGKFVQLSDLSPKYKYPVFSSFTNDRGYRVVGFGTSFPVRASRPGATYFLTNSHVVDSGEQIINECQRFYAAMRLLAEQSAGGESTVKERFEELQTIVRMPQVKRQLTSSERAVYTQTIDGIWDCYETYLSRRVDAGRLLFDKYKQLAPINFELGYFLHAPGPVTQQPLKGHLYRVARNQGDPDLAVLFVKSLSIPPMELDMLAPAEGQEVQVIGYPIASDQIDEDSAKYYAPTFNTGRISRVAPRMLQVDAGITTGNSGGPVVNQRGKVIGVVVKRAISSRGVELPTYGSAITAQWVRAFAPELFGNLSSSQ